LSPSDFELAKSKNITIELLTANYVEDKRLSDIANKADKTYVDEIASKIPTDAHINELIQQPSYVNTDISVIDTGLTYARGLLMVKVVGSTLWVIDSGVYNFTDSFKTSKNRTVLQFTLPKSISDKLPNTNGVYGGTGTISYFPALAYENVTYTTFNCQSYLKRSKIGETEDTFQVVYTGLNAISGGGLCGFHLRMQLLLV
jgi:hypothetical protein